MHLWVIFTHWEHDSPNPLCLQCLHLSHHERSSLRSCPHGDQTHLFCVLQSNRPNGSRKPSGCKRTFLFKPCLNLRFDFNTLPSALCLGSDTSSSDLRPLALNISCAAEASEYVQVKVGSVSTSASVCLRSSALNLANMFQVFLCSRKATATGGEHISLLQ